MRLLQSTLTVAVGASLAFAVACDEPTTPLRPGDPDAGMCETPETTPEPTVEDVAPVSHRRLLRRVHLTLHGRPPLDEDVSALDDATSDAEREAVIEAAIADGLESPDFYDRMVDFGHWWLRNGAFVTGAQGDAYMGNMSAHLGRCADDTAHPGAYFLLASLVDEVGIGERTGSQLCTEASPTTRTVEPWWAPGTSVVLLGEAASEASQGTTRGGDPVACGVAVEEYFNMQMQGAGCGCGPNAAWCYPGHGLHIGNDRPGTQRRDMWEEPARLVAHLAWHDRPLSDVVLGNYTVANNRVRAWYLRFGRQSGLPAAALDGNDTWFRPDVGGEPRDPRHPDAADPEAWRELVPEELAPQLLSLSGGVRSADPARTLAWNPVDDAGPAPGLPMAGVLTMPGPSSSFPRERPRAARFLEIFACRSFDPPPPDVHFPPVGEDIATSGQCMHCHTVMDPVAMTFRRWIFVGNYVPRPYLAGVGDLQIPTDLFEPSQRYPHRAWFGAGADRWRQNWTANTVMTPVSAETLAANPATLFYDTIPTDYTIFGEHPDGTMGPLAFAKVLVSSGELDRCAVRRIYERFVGRPLDPEREAGFIRALAARFAAGDRQVRPFVGELMRSPEYRRGF